MKYQIIFWLLTLALEPGPSCCFKTRICHVLSQSSWVKWEILPFTQDTKLVYAIRFFSKMRAMIIFKIFICAPKWRVSFLLLKIQYHLAKKWKDDFINAFAISSNFVQLKLKFFHWTNIHKHKKKKVIQPPPPKAKPKAPCPMKQHYKNSNSEKF